jgi:hypothetical protein
MLGTPNQGAYSMVENLLGKGDTLRSLVRLDVTHDMQEVLQIVAGFRGALQLLPKPGFVDIFQGQSDGGDDKQDFQLAPTWQDYRKKVFDLWFGNGNSATPTSQQLDAANWLWHRTARRRRRCREDYEKKAVYVFGVARNTPVRNTRGGRAPENGRHQPGRRHRHLGFRPHRQCRQLLLPAGQAWRPAVDREYFGALGELLSSGGDHRGLLTQPAGACRRGRRSRWATTPARRRSTAARRWSAVCSAVRRPHASRRAEAFRLEVAVKAMDLRFLPSRSARPLRAGSDRRRRGADRPRTARRRPHPALQPGPVYAGPRGTASVVLRVPNEQARRRAASPVPSSPAWAPTTATSAPRSGRGGARRRAALPAAGHRRARQGRARTAAGGAAARLQLFRQPLGGGFGRGARARRHRRPMPFYADDALAAFASAASTSSSSIRTRRSPPATRCANARRRLAPLTRRYEWRC